MDMDNITVITHEGDLFEVTRRIAQLSEFISCIFHLVACETTTQIDLGDLDIDSSSFQLILNYGLLHDFEAIKPKSSGFKGATLRDMYDPIDVDFIEAVDEDRLLSLCLAAKSMGIEPLVELILRAIGVLVADKNSAELAEMMDLSISIDERKEAFMKADAQWALYPSPEFS